MSNSVLSTETLDKTKLAELDQYIAGLPNKSEAIIHILHRGQEIFGYLPKELQLYIARKADLPAAKVNGIVSFYSFFSQEPSGKYQLSICLGTACFVKGADAVIKEFRKQLDMVDKRVSDDGRFSILICFHCIGAKHVDGVGDGAFHLFQFVVGGDKIDHFALAMHLMQGVVGMKSGFESKSLRHNLAGILNIEGDNIENAAGTGFDTDAEYFQRFFEFTIHVVFLLKIKKAHSFTSGVTYRPMFWSLLLFLDHCSKMEIMDLWIC